MRPVFSVDGNGYPVPANRFRARSMYFQDQSIFSYPHANKQWWGYA
jgi:hypothetical protein